jgi:opacity protein-like surface antigen
MKKALLLALAVVLAPSLANAQIRQVRSSPAGGNNTVNFTIGYFALKGLDSRVNDDVLLGDLQNGQPLLFEVKDFNGASIGGEYLLGIGSNFEAGVGLGFYQRTVPSVYANLTHSNGDEIQQDLKLRTVPVTFTGRFLLLPRGSAAEPYVGAGIAAVRWRYSETGEFVDVDNSIFPARYIADGTATGPIVLAGIRFPFDAVVAGGEVRWQKVQGDIPVDVGMLGTKIDLGGWTTNFTLGVRF